MDTLYTLLNAMWPELWGVLLVTGALLLIKARTSGISKRYSDAKNYQTLFANCAEGMCIVSQETGTILEANPAAAMLLGYTAAELTGLGPQNISVDKPAALQMLTNTEGRPLTHTFVHKNGTLLKVESIGTPVVWHEKPAILHALRNLETLSAVEEDLNRCTSILDCCNEPAALINKQMRIVRVNKAYTYAVGIPEEDLIGLHFKKLFGEKHFYEKTYHLFLRCFKGEQSSIERTMQLVDGRTVFVSITLTPYPLDSENTTHLILTVTDHTDRLLREQELYKSKQHTTAIVNSMPTTLLCVTPNLHITHANTEATQLCNLSAADLRGKYLNTALPSGLHVRPSSIQEALSCKEPLHMGMTTIQTPKGKRHMEVSIFPLAVTEYDEVVIRIDDVSERIQMENTIVQSEKMLSLGGLAAGMAHEINNPLGGIMQGSQNIQRRLSTELPKNHEVAQKVGTTMQTLQEYMNQRGIIEMLEGIRECGARASSIVEDMLEFSSPSRDLRTQENIAKILEKTISLAATDYDLKKNFDFKRITICRQYDPHLPPVSCSVSEIEQVVFNLLKNAAHSMTDNPTEKTPLITVRTYREHGHAVIEIEDNGPGIPQEIQHRIFEPFYTTKDPGVGTGLGLSVSYFIINRNHGGKMECHSEEGKGANFRFTLPLVE